jgi:integrase
MECLRLRVQDIDFGRCEIVIRDGDRRTMFPETQAAPMKEHLARVKLVHDQDLAEGWGKVKLPHALERKYPNSLWQWRWQWVFPQENRRKNAKAGEEGRHHIHENLLQGAMKEAVSKAGIVKHIGCHTWPFIRYPPPGGRIRHPNDPGVAWA